MMGYIPHLITLALCIMVMVLVVKNALTAYRSMRPDSLQGLVLLVCFFQAGVIITFVTVQAGWVLKSHDELVGMSAQLGWLAYDYQNKLFHICTALLIGHWLRCRRANELDK